MYPMCDVKSRRAPRDRPSGAAAQLSRVRRRTGTHFAPRLSIAVPGAYNCCLSQVSDKRKQSLYFPEEMLREIQREATRQDRSLSWIMQRAWMTARATVGTMPGTEDLCPTGTTPRA